MDGYVKVSGWVDVLAGRFIVKRLLVPILSVVVLALAGPSGGAWADSVATDPAVTAPADPTTSVSADPTMLTAQSGPPSGGGGSGGGGGGGGGGGNPPALAFSKTCEGSAGTAPGPGQNDNCTIHVQGSVPSNSVVSILLGSPQNSTITSCGGGSQSGTTRCVYNFPTGTTSGFIGFESFTVSASANPGTPVFQAASLCRMTSCWGYPVAVTGAGAVVGTGGPPPGPPPPGPPFVTKSCSGPDSGGTVYAGQQDSCTVSAAAGDTFHAANRITVTPTSPPGTTVAACFGVAGVTSAAVNAGGSSCTFMVLTGATVNPGQPLGTELINIPATAVSGTPVVQAAGWCSGPPEGICYVLPAQVTATGPGGSVSTDPAISASGTAVAATEGQSFAGTVATFSDADPSGQPSEYSATIDWGDGTSSAGTIDGWSVSGSHTYAEEGTYVVTVTISDADTAYNVAHALGSATVADAALAAQGRSINSTNPFSGTVATFTDADPNGAVTDYTATVDWGDGTTSPGTIAQDGAGFDVNGTHAYTQLGPYTVTVHVCDAGGACADATSSILVYGLTSGGSFVIGDGSAAPGSAVTFWGAQWASANVVSGGSAPADFKGFADNPNGAPGCGTSWSTRPGNSSKPPPDVPAYAAVIVSSSIIQDAARSSGNTTEVVIVRTDPGYADDPGHAGTGTVVAVLCP